MFENVHRAMCGGGWGETKLSQKWSKIGDIGGVKGGRGVPWHSTPVGTTSFLGNVV